MIDNAPKNTPDNYARVKTAFLFFVGEFFLIVVLSTSVAVWKFSLEIAVNYFVKHTDKVLMAGLPAALLIGVLAFHQTKKT